MAVWVAVELPEEIAETIVSLVRSGRYQSISMLVEEALRAYLELGEAIEKYLEARRHRVERSRGINETGFRGFEETC